MAKSTKQKVTDYYKRIGMGIKFWRKLDNQNQEIFSHKLGSSRSCIAKMETGATGISLIKIVEVAGVFKLQDSTIGLGAPHPQALNIVLGLVRKHNITRKELEEFYRLVAVRYNPNREECLKLLDIVNPEIIKG